MKLLLSVACLLILLINPLFAGQTTVPEIVEKGFSKYAQEGPKEAIVTWTKNSAIEGSRDAISQANSFNQIEEFFGSYVGYEVVKNIQLTESTSILLLNIKYKKGNLYSTFYCYKLENGETILNRFDFNTKPELIWPNSIIFGYFEKLG